MRSRRQYTIQNVYVADGFSDDCEDLIQNCTKGDVLTYQAFCDVWKEMNLACIYHGRTSAAELAELSEEVFQVAKYYIVQNTSNFEETVAGLFLVYALFHTQPFSNFARLRLTPADIDAIKLLENTARAQKRYDVLYVLGAVLVKCTHYHVDARERGGEKCIRKYLEGHVSIDRSGIRPKGVFYRQNQELDILRELNSLSRKYSAAKANIVTSDGKQDKSLNYTNDNLARELDASLKKVINGIYDDDEEEKDPSSRERSNKLESIKSRAMKNEVNPLKHLETIEERKSPKKKTDLKVPKSKTNSVSPKALSNCGTSFRVRATLTAGSFNIDDVPRSKRFKFKGKVSAPGNSSEVEEEEEEGEVTEQEINLNVDSLPPITDTEQDVVIEFIDKYKKDEVEQSSNTETEKKVSKAKGRKRKIQATVDDSTSELKEKSKPQRKGASKKKKK